MQRIFTLAFVFALLAFSKTGISQTCSVAAACPPTVEDFSDGASGFTGSTFTYDAVDDRFEAELARNTGGSITSFALQPTGSIVTVGGEFTGASGAVSVELLDVNGNVLVTCPVGTATSFCRTFSGLTAGTVYRVRFTFTRGNTEANQAILVTFDNFGLDPAGAALPVSFISFNAQKVSNSTQLTWKVGEEDNVKGYEIERSTDGREFTSVGFVAASGKSTYTFNDAQSTQGTVFYRIRNVDNDGKFKYSNILSLKNGASSLVLRAFPLPALSKLTVQHEAAFNNGKINIASSDGSVVKRIIPTPGSLETTVNLVGLKSGIYILHFDSGNGKTQTMKFMKQ